MNFTCWQGKEQIAEIFKTARFLIFPSVWYETYGLVVQEAASYGIPSIVSDCIAACELITDGVDGLIFTSADFAHLAGIMSKLIEDDDFAQLLVKAAYNNF